MFFLDICASPDFSVSCFHSQSIALAGLEDGGRSCCFGEREVKSLSGLVFDIDVDSKYPVSRFALDRTLGRNL